MYSVLSWKSFSASVSSISQSNLCPSVLEVAQHKSIVTVLAVSSADGVCIWEHVLPNIQIIIHHTYVHHSFSLQIFLMLCLHTRNLAELG